MQEAGAVHLADDSSWELQLILDNRTRWNSTYDMLDTAVRYRKAVDRLCSDKKNKLRSYELSKEEWEIARQLREILKVRVPNPAAAQTESKPTPTMLR